MASSRWKKFAFFQKETLQLPTDVAEDLTTTTTTTTGAVVSLVTVSARLPQSWKSDQQQQAAAATTTSSSSLLAAVCNPMQAVSNAFETTSHDNNDHDDIVVDDDNDNNNGTLLRLAFVASSSSSSRIHCLHTQSLSWVGYFCASCAAPIVALDACFSNRSTIVLIVTETSVQIQINPHLELSCQRPLDTTTTTTTTTAVAQEQAWRTERDGQLTTGCMDANLVAVGTTTGLVVLYTYNQQQQEQLRTYLRVSACNGRVAAVRMSMGAVTVATSTGMTCYHVAWPVESGRDAAAPPPPRVAAPLARYDLDGRPVESSALVVSSQENIVVVAHPDGLYTYSTTERIAVAPVDGGPKAVLAMVSQEEEQQQQQDKQDTERRRDGYALVASTGSNESKRVAVDVYDTDNKLVAFHMLLSPGQTAVAATGWARTALVLTSGGTVLALREKSTRAKIDLLTAKNLYSAAIVIAYADPAWSVDACIQLYRRYAEYLYQKGDFASAMDQYIHTIGSLETSHVLYRYLDAPKIPHLVRYLVELRKRELATPTHLELLRTCYLKLNDTEAAEALAAATARGTSSKSLDKGALVSIVNKISSNPKEALAAVCSLDAFQAAEFLVLHGASLVRRLPRETTGVVLALCLGTFSPDSLAEASLVDKEDLRQLSQPKASQPFPLHMFAPAFVEQPRMLRLLLAHCHRHKCPLTPHLRRTFLELTLEAWNDAKRQGDTEAVKMRQKEAIAALTDSHSSEIGDYDALVIVQQAGFEEGELVLYERLQMTPALLERYAKDGSEKSRRQMLAMGKADPEVLADVLWHLVSIAGSKLASTTQRSDEEEEELETVMEEIQEALTLARRQGVLPPVRIARILAGESSGQFTSPPPPPPPGGKGPPNQSSSPRSSSIPLAVALDYVGSMLEESRTEIGRLESEVEEYSTLCEEMEQEIRGLTARAGGIPPASAGRVYLGTTEEDEKKVDNESGGADSNDPYNVDEIYLRMRAEERRGKPKSTTAKPTEAFWRELTQTEDTFGTIARYFGKGVIA